MDQSIIKMGEKDLYGACRQSLVPLYGADEAKAVVRLLLEEEFGLTLTDLVCGKADTLSESDKERLEKMMTRLVKGEPVQYVVGRSRFCGRAFHVEPGVLIPRPETEELCHMIVAQHNKPYCALQPPMPLQVLDVGTGSGCIAATLALDLYNAEVSAWDISPDALLVARGNAKALGAKVNLELQDALRPPADENRWDIIVSNPPYVTEREREDMSTHVLDHEPHLALFVPDDDALRFYHAIAAYGRRALKKGGTLFFEINPLYAEDMAKMMEQIGFVGIKVVEDRFGKQRFVQGWA